MEKILKINTAILFLVSSAIASRNMLLFVETMKMGGIASRNVILFNLIGVLFVVLSLVLVFRKNFSLVKGRSCWVLILFQLLASAVFHVYSLLFIGIIVLNIYLFISSNREPIKTYLGFQK